jgi:hypothetical protein
MSLTVTLHIYSGRPNPQWVLPDAAAREFEDRLKRTAATARLSNLKPAGITGSLGYRGFTVQDSTDSRVITLHAGVIDPGRLSMTLLTENRELEQWLLDTGKASVPELTMVYAARQVSTAVLQGPIDWHPPLQRCNPCMAKDARPLELSLWTATAGASNNCYNYANDRMTNTTAQPGKASGHPFTQEATCVGGVSVQDAAVADGLVPCANFTDPLAAGQGWYVALVLWPGHDFHWYRQDDTGCWSQKMGYNDPSQYDNANKLIRDPKAADRGPYTVFCTYMVTKCCVKIR